MEVVRFSDEAGTGLLATSLNDSLRLEEWPVAPGVRRPVVLSRFEVYAPDARIVRIVDGQEIELPRSPLAFFKGTTADGDEPARVVAWVDPVLGVRGGFAIGPDGMVEMEPDPDAKAGRSLRVLSSEARFGEGDERRPTFACAQGEGETAHFSVPDTLETLGEAYRAVVPTQLAPLATTPTKTAVIAFDTDAEWIALRHGGSIAGTINHLTQLVALMTIIYERDAGPAKDQGVRILQGYSIIRATEAEDPYADTTGGASGTKLNELTNYWEANYPRSVVKRALVALVSGKQSNVPVTSASGIAWVGGLCNGVGYSVNQLMTGSSSGFWDMLIMAHEVGHNFGSPHTHCYPNPKPDTCYGSETGTNCFSGAGSCPGSATYNGVTTNGTLMSYCHTPPVSCSPRNDNVFHPTSVSSYLLPNINGASCLATVPGGIVPSGPNSIGISPTSGPLAGGQSVTITGGGFATGTTVAFVELPSNNVFGGSPNTKLLTGVSIVNANTITAVTPSATNTGLVDVVVMNSDQQTAFIRNGYTYSTGPVSPSVTAINPNFGPAAGGTAVTITGASFVDGATVRFSGTSATGVGFVNATTLTATTPARAAGLANLTVTNPDAQAGTLANAYFFAPAPTATRWFPVTPCRILDTRNANGALGGPVLSANQTRLFDVTTTPTTCGIPATAKALSVNYSVFAPQQAGELRVYPGNGVPTIANIVPFKVNETRANNGHLTLSTDNTGTFNVRNASNGTIHFILDVNGYYQ
ncbi:MAG: IPT/TIG domain-containing protein [Holophagales bacterium]|nr:IPT/TIG domain-containing protein [Holophagales bacterium]